MGGASFENNCIYEFNFLSVGRYIQHLFPFITTLPKVLSSIFEWLVGGGGGRNEWSGFALKCALVRTTVSI